MSTNFALISFCVLAIVLLIMLSVSVYTHLKQHNADGAKWALAVAIVTLFTAVCLLVAYLGLNPASHKQNILLLFVSAAAIICGLIYGALGISSAIKHRYD